MKINNDAYVTNMSAIVDELDERAARLFREGRDHPDDEVLERTAASARQKIEKVRQVLSRDAPSRDPAAVRSEISVIAAQVRVDLGCIEMRLRELARSES